MSTEIAHAVLELVSGTNKKGGKLPQVNSSAKTITIGTNIVLTLHHSKFMRTSMYRIDTQKRQVGGEKLHFKSIHKYFCFFSHEHHNSNNILLNV